MSREHYISHTVLKAIAQDGLVKLDGFSWQKQKAAWIPSATLARRILCKRHNEALSPLDAEAGRFMRAVRDFHANLSSGRTRDEVRSFAGEDLEKWMLKTLTGMVASGNVVGLNDVPEPWINQLFRCNPLHEPLGLYLDRSAEVRLGRHFYFQPTFYGKEGLVTAEMHVHGLQFFLLVAPQAGVPYHAALYRPGFIALKRAGATKLVDLSWQDERYTAGITFEHSGRYADTQKPAPTTRPLWSLGWGRAWDPIFTFHSPIRNHGLNLKCINV